MTLALLGLAMVVLPSAVIDEDAPVESRTPVISEQAEVAPPPPDQRADAPRGDEVEGLDGPILGLLQLAGACAVYTVAAPAIFVTAYLCPFTLCVACTIPGAAAYASTWIGDRFGKTRAPAIWPIVASYGVLMVGGVGLAAVYFGAFTSNPLMSFGGGIGMLAGLVGSAVAIPVAYALAAEEKHPGDDGDGWPGLFAAAHPATGRRRPARRSTAPLPEPTPNEPVAPLPELPLPPLLEPQGALRIMRF
ncbi:MAG: hypothetical protein IT383_28660 [Deltaproteobacteria bacterium]|nr:hypothetical protein [Deltaproteobacteria bacterium]